MKRFSIQLFAILLLAAASWAYEVEGINVPETVCIGGSTLRLNGAGLRKKLSIKVYVGALYLENFCTRVDDIINSGRPRSIRLTFLLDVSKHDIIVAYKEGLERNSKDRLAQFQTRLNQLGAGLQDVESGDVMTVTYVPGKGTTISQQGGSSVTVAGKDFADALLLNWLGNEPADVDLKQAMLFGK